MSIGIPYSDFFYVLLNITSSRYTGSTDSSWCMSVDVGCGFSFNGSVLNGCQNNAVGTIKRWGESTPERRNWTSTYCRWRSTGLCQWGGQGSEPGSWLVHRCHQTATGPGWREARPRLHCACLHRNRPKNQIDYRTSVELWIKTSLCVMTESKRLTQHVQLSLRVPGVVSCERVDGVCVHLPT